MHPSEFPIVGGGGGGAGGGAQTLLILQFFPNFRHQNWCPPWGAHTWKWTPHIWETHTLPTNPLPPLKSEAF